jgi:hypothetical protein
LHSRGAQKIAFKELKSEIIEKARKDVSNFVDILKIKDLNSNLTEISSTLFTNWQFIK